MSVGIGMCIFSQMYLIFFTIMLSLYLFRVVDDLEQYQHMVIERSGPACNMLLEPYNMDVPPINHTNIDVEE